MSFHEKSARACLLSLLLVYIPYFVLVFQHPIAFVGLFPLAAIILVVLLTAFHIVNAVMTPSILKTGDIPPHDELDRIIEMRAAKLSGVVLSVAVISWCMTAMYFVPAIGVGEIVHAEVTEALRAPAQFRIPMNLALTAIQFLFAGFVIANFAYYGSIASGYRRLADG